MVIARDPEVGFLGRTVELPEVMADGTTVAACAEQVLQATTFAIAWMLEAKQRPPTPSREDVRDRQVNIRLSAHERLRIESLAQSQGFRSTSDYLRAAGLRGAA